ncbi:hypothetical protein Tco_0308353 [Tanacetum coccineum]
MDQFPLNLIPKPEINWVNTYVTTYQVPAENKLQRKTYDIGSFIKWFCRRTGKKKLCKADLEAAANKVDLDNPEGPSNSAKCDKERRRIALSISKLKATRYLDFGLEELVPTLWVESKREYDISAVYGITHWWYEEKGIHTTTNTVSPLIGKQSDPRMQILNLFPTNIKKSSPSAQRQTRPSLHTAVNHVGKKPVIRNRVGDLQLGIESYQTKINLERPNWDAADYYFKEDYTIVPKPRVIVYRDRNDERKLMRLNEL